MTDTSLFFSMRPAFPWSVYPVGLPALAVVAALLVVLTVWTYLGHPQATRKRVLIVLALRLAALAVTLLTAVRPSAGFQEEPKVPSVLMIGIDGSGSMTVSMSFHGVTASGEADVQSTNFDYAAASAGTGIDTARDANNSWLFNINSGTIATYDITVNFAGLIDAAADPTTFAERAFSG